MLAKAGMYYRLKKRKSKFKSSFFPLGFMDLETFINKLKIYIFMYALLALAFFTAATKLLKEVHLRPPDFLPYFFTSFALMAHYF